MLSPSSEHSQRSKWEIFLGFGIPFVRRANLFVSGVSSAAMNKCPCQKMIIWKGICLSGNTLHLFESLTYIYSKVFSKCYMGIILCHVLILIRVSKYLSISHVTSLTKLERWLLPSLIRKCYKDDFFFSIAPENSLEGSPLFTWLTIHSILLASRDFAPHF